MNNTTKQHCYCESCRVLTYLSSNKGLVISYGEGWVTTGGNRGSKTCCAPPPLLNDGNILYAHFSMAKTSSSHVKTTSELLVPPLSAWL